MHQHDRAQARCRSYIPSLPVQTGGRYVLCLLLCPHPPALAKEEFYLEHLILGNREMVDVGCELSLLVIGALSMQRRTLTFLRVQRASYPDTDTAPPSPPWTWPVCAIPAAVQLRPGRLPRFLETLGDQTAACDRDCEP